MALMTFYAAQCDLCEERSEAFHAGIFTKHDAWQLLSPIGWTRRQLNTGAGLAYRCPSCSSNQFPGKPDPDTRATA